MISALAIVATITSFVDNFVCYLLVVVRLLRRDERQLIGAFCVVSLVAGMGGLVCSFLIGNQFLRGTLTNIIGITLLVFCSLGVLVAFARGWMDGLKTVMWIWSGCIAVLALASVWLLVADR